MKDETPKKTYLVNDEIVGFKKFCLVTAIFVGPGLVFFLIFGLITQSFIKALLFGVLGIALFKGFLHYVGVLGSGSHPNNDDSTARKWITSPSTRGIVCGTYKRTHRIRLPTESEEQEL